MKKILSKLQKIENIIMIGAFALMVSTSFVAVINRNIFKISIAWLDELAVYSMIYMVLIGTEMGLRDGTQISVTSVVDKFHGKSKKVIHIISKLIVVGFSLMIFISSISMVKAQVRTGQISPGLKLPMSVPYAALPISFGIITLVQGFNLLTMILGFNKDDIMDGEV